MCAIVCVLYTIDTEAVMWRSDHELGSVPSGILPSSPMQPLSTPFGGDLLYFSHVDVDDTNRKDGELSVTWAIESPPTLRQAGVIFFGARAWALSHVDGLSARLNASEICLGDKLPTQEGKNSA